MDTMAPTEGIGYCGLVCEVCSHANEGCQQCRSSGGDEQCHQRICCVEKGLDSCWQCDGFPCDEGYFAGTEWSGLCIGLTRVIKNHGPETLVRLVRSGLGQIVEYGDYRFRPSDEVEHMLDSD